MFLAVEKNGTEKASPTKMFRLSVAVENAKEYDARYEMLDNAEDSWCNNYSRCSFPIPMFQGVVMPKGTIKKILGRELTFEDGVIEYNG